MRTKKEVFGIIKSLDLPPIVLRIFEGAVPIPELRDYCQSPFYSFSCDANFPDSLIPLWESGIQITAYDVDAGSFCRFSLEYPEEPYFEEISFRGVVSFLLRDLWEGEFPIDQIENVAEAFRYDQLPVLIAVLEAGALRDEYSLSTAELFS